MGMQIKKPSWKMAYVRHVQSTAHRPQALQHDLQCGPPPSLDLKVAVLPHGAAQGTNPSLSNSQITGALLTLCQQKPEHEGSTVQR